MPRKFKINPNIDLLDSKTNYYFSVHPEMEEMQKSGKVYTEVLNPFEYPIDGPYEVVFADNSGDSYTGYWSFRIDDLIEVF